MLEAVRIAELPRLTLNAERSSALLWIVSAEFSTNMFPVEVAILTVSILPRCWRRASSSKRLNGSAVNTHLGHIWNLRDETARTTKAAAQ